jgi:UDP-3-O-[3-hydroxymyristoyl] glucosamine N-acyltransferase
MEFTIAQLAFMLDGTFEGDGEQKVNMIAKIQEAKPQQITFLSNPTYEPHIYNTKASAVIVSSDFIPKKSLETTLIRVENPYLAFSAILDEYQKFINYQKTGIEEPSYIGVDSIVGDDIYRGAFSYVGSNVKIGNNVKIYPHAYIGDNSTIGDNTILHAGVKLYANSILGNNCVLHAGVVIGSDGFGFAPQKDGTYKNIPQLGNVEIGDNVHIGGNTVVDCAAMPSDSTIIGKGVKLDNLIQIGHNVKIGKNTVIAAQTAIAGSTEIGENCVFAGQVAVSGHLKVPNNTSIGGQSGLGKNLKKEGMQMFGSPAFDVKEYYKSYAMFKNLPDLNTRIKQLEEKVLNLPTN